MVKILTSKNFLLTQDSWVQSKKWRFLRDYLINFLFLPSLFKLMQSSADMKLHPTEMLWEIISWHVSSWRSTYRRYGIVISSRNYISPPPPRASNQSKCLKSILKSATYSFTNFGLSLLCWIFDQWKLGYYKCKLLQKTGWS